MRNSKKLKKENNKRRADDSERTSTLGSRGKHLQSLSDKSPPNYNHLQTSSAQQSLDLEASTMFIRDKESKGGGGGGEQ